MANEEHLTILMKGVNAWNKWRGEVYYSEIDLSRANLKRADLKRADLSGVNLRRANLRKADFREAHLDDADLSEANLQGASFDGANLRYANLSLAELKWANFSKANLVGADLSQAHLVGADLIQADLSQADLTDAILRGANLVGANLSRADLIRTDFTRVSWGITLFNTVDLSATVGLEGWNHQNPSIIGTDTLQLSKGKIPAEFLSGCGLSDFEIESAKLYDPDLSNQEINEILYRIYDVRARQAIQVSPLFISYSRKDDAFVNRLEVELNERGIRFWRDIHDAKAGRLETQIEHAIRHNPTVLLVLSESALESDWVQHEVRKARGLEKELGRDVLCPVTLDNGWMSSRWPERVMEQVMEYNILDFSQWQDDAVFQKMFVKLLDGLQLFYKK